MTTAKAVAVRIAPHRSVLVEGRQVGAGEVVTVPGQDAQTLIAEGYAEKPDAKPKAKASKSPSESQRAPRRPLTPTAIDDGDEERGG